MKCTWKFETTPGHRINLTFDFFEVETHTECLFDSLRLYDGNSTHAPLLARLCGYRIPQPMISTTQTLFMVFESDESVQK
ncbi:Dorsal-ventral patterning tolloid-like protein 1, partial [Stegodyphus mimosarum]